MCARSIVLFWRGRCISVLSSDPIDLLCGCAFIIIQSWVWNQLSVVLNQGNRVALDCLFQDVLLLLLLLLCTTTRTLATLATVAGKSLLKSFVLYLSKPQACGEQNFVGTVL